MSLVFLVGMRSSFSKMSLMRCLQCQKKHSKDEISKLSFWNHFKDYILIVCYVQEISKTKYLSHKFNLFYLLTTRIYTLR